MTDSFEKMCRGETGLGPSTRDKIRQYTASTGSLDENEVYKKIGWHVGASLSTSYLEEQGLVPIEARGKSEAMQFAEFAAQEALDHAQWHPTNDLDKYRTGVCIGNSMVDMDYIADNHNMIASGKDKRVSPYFVPRVLCNMAAGHVAIKFGFRGPNHAVSTACATGSHSIGDAWNFIRNGQAEVMLAGGTDTCINPLSIVGFMRARALSTKFKDNPGAASRPFDKDRDGFVMSEGAAVLVLEDLDHAKARGAEIICEVVGYGASCDADHVTAGLPDGSGAVLAIISALNCVEKHESFEDLLWLINCHATSTPRGDEAEMNAIKRVLALLKENVINIKLDQDGPYVTANKGNVGHMIGAAGAVESAFAALSLKTGKIPKIANLDHPGDGIGEGVRLVRDTIVVEKNNDSESDRRLVLKNSFGFGGTNVSLVFAEYIP